MTEPTLTDILAKLKTEPEWHDYDQRSDQASASQHNQTRARLLAVVETAIAQDQLLELIRTETINDRDIRPGKYTMIRNQITAKLAAALEGEKA